MPNELKILNGIDVETVLKSLPQGDHVNAMWFCNAAAAIETTILDKLRQGVEVPEPYGYLVYDPRFQSQDFIEGELDGDFEGQKILPLIAATDVIQYGAAQRLAGREQAIEECARECMSKHANGNYKYDTREDCHLAILALAASPQEQT